MLLPPKIVLDCRDAILAPEKGIFMPIAEQAAARSFHQGGPREAGELLSDSLMLEGPWLLRLKVDQMVK